MRSHESLRILVVDDEPLLCWALAETLSDRGDTVDQADSGAAAVRALTTEREPDVVLLDYQLPDSCDFSLLATVKRLAPHSRVILMSSYYTPEWARQALAQGASRVVNKPIDMRDVAELVHSTAGVPLV